MSNDNKVQLGANGPLVSKIGYGAMGLSAFYGTNLSADAAGEVLSRVIAAGCTFWDTSDVYMNNEDVIGEWFEKTGRRDEIFLASKFGVNFGGDGRAIRGDREYIRQCCDKSLARLKTDHLDLYYQHRTDPSTPIEETVAALAELVKEGKIRYIGLSECNEATLRRAHKVHPITAIQIEYSPFVQFAETIGLAAACRELGVGIVAYSPLKQGFVAGSFSTLGDLSKEDTRFIVPQFEAENVAHNLALVERMDAMAKKKGVTKSQLVLAWLVSRGVVPIPGTTKVERVDENYAMFKNPSLALTPEEVAEFDANEFHTAVIGERSSPWYMEALLVDTPEK
ncbi:NADP-dependent oxidoreductase domain-containing protein [Dipodascopsis tothii]|uniref:NADP-dependent oxidoreductase domain-containing protein n=1 Tax=Dipodascopsis tothii TaxID=44089 RepID=UPI0034CE912B